MTLLAAQLQWAVKVKGRSRFALVGGVGLARWSGGVTFACTWRCLWCSHAEAGGFWLILAHN